MDSLRTFMDEMLNDQGRKDGIFYNYDTSEVTISYKVVPDMYAPYTLSFDHFEVVLEGLLTSRRNKKWQVNHKL